MSQTSMKLPRRLVVLLARIFRDDALKAAAGGELAGPGDAGVVHEPSTSCIACSGSGTRNGVKCVPCDGSGEARCPMTPLLLAAPCGRCELGCPYSASAIRDAPPSAQLDDEAREIFDEVHRRLFGEQLKAVAIDVPPRRRPRYILSRRLAVLLVVLGCVAIVGFVALLLAVLEDVQGYDDHRNIDAVLIFAAVQALPCGWALVGVCRQSTLPAWPRDRARQQQSPAAGQIPDTDRTVGVDGTRK